MAELRPFRAYRYERKKVKLERVLTQPYDKISPTMQEQYYARDPDNLIAVEKGRTLPGDSSANNVYTRAAATLERWIAAGVIRQDSEPSLYAYFQRYKVPGTGAEKERRGFIALGRVEDYEAGVVHRHERTLAGPKADRLELLRHTKTHTGQLFMLYADAKRRVDAILARIARKPATASLRDDFGVRHRLWQVSDPSVIAQVQAAMAHKKLVIADGHHRYETALAYRNERRVAAGSADPQAPWEFVMMTLFNSEAPGLTILPTHRLVANLAGFDWNAIRRKLETWFEVKEVRLANPKRLASAAARIRSEMEKRRKARAIGLYTGGNAWYRIELRKGLDLAKLLPGTSAAERDLDVVLLHRLVLEQGLGISAEAVERERNITYVRELEAALAAVDRGDAQLVCLLNAVRVERVMEMALAGEVLPQKSTDFYPKLLSGIAIYQLEVRG